jgi:hypothetical protein
VQTFECSMKNTWGMKGILMLYKTGFWGGLLYVLQLAVLMFLCAGR